MRLNVHLLTIIENTLHSQSTFAGPGLNLKLAMINTGTILYILSFPKLLGYCHIPQEL